jgi:hypothetical protein
MVERLGCIIACIWMTISYRGRADVRTGETSILATHGAWCDVKFVPTGRHELLAYLSADS